MEVLKNAIKHDAAIRRVQRLQPAGGPGDKIFPPTYPGARRGDPPRHVFEKRHVKGEVVWSVLIDSVQSQANRLEEILLEAAKTKKGIPLPYVKVDFSGKGLEPLDEITSLDAPHRVYDAILRDSFLDNEPFMKSEQGQRLAAAKPADATALLEISPTALLFGAWHSQGEGGGLGAKFPRSIVSEIVGIDTPVEEILSNQRTGEIEPRTSGRRTGSRIDPLGVLKKVEVFKGTYDWSTDKEEAGPKVKKVRPSEINHGNIPPLVEPLGVTCAYAEHRVVITLAGLRRLHFGGGNRDIIGRTLIVALGLLSVFEQDSRGYALRSRCDLVCDGFAPLELVHADGSTEPIELDAAKARDLYETTYESAVSAGFNFESLTLTPQPKLIKIVQDSRKLALEGEGGEEDSE